MFAFSKWNELTLGTNSCFLELGRIIVWDELSLYKFLSSFEWKTPYDESFCMHNQFFLNKKWSQHI